MDFKIALISFIERVLGSVLSFLKWTFSLLTRLLSIIDSSDHKTGREATSVKNEHFPPAQHVGETYVLVDETKHSK